MRQPCDPLNLFLHSNVVETRERQAQGVIGISKTNVTTLTTSKPQAVLRRELFNCTRIPSAGLSST